MVDKILKCVGKNVGLVETYSDSDFSFSCLSGQIL